MNWMKEINQQYHSFIQNTTYSYVIATIKLYSLWISNLKVHKK